MYRVINIHIYHYNKGYFNEKVYKKQKANLWDHLLISLIGLSSMRISVFDNELFYFMKL